MFLPSFFQIWLDLNSFSTLFDFFIISSELVYCFLGIAINLMSENRVLQAVHILMHLLQESEWEIRHGALLGIKYMLAVREVGTYYIISGFFVPR